MNGVLLPEMEKLLRTSFVKFVQMRCATSCPNLKKIDFKTRENQHQDDKLAIGMNERSLLVDAMPTTSHPPLNRSFLLV